ncbi:MAG: hypothetical protein QHH19_06720 [Candidatus Thermoplasmatota archaeon]|jgi:hypothetical protein|nr:hypothetical protein [Candidatus Thermoplasmatota archaeon]
MRIIKNIIVFLIVITSLFSIFSNVTAIDNIIININMLEGKRQTRFNQPVIVAGIWHYVNISTRTGSLDTFTFRLYKGYTVPSIGARDETNYYEWKYDKNSMNVWTDISGYSVDYIISDRCSKNGDTYSFCIGVKDTFPNIVGYYENWTIEVYENENKLHSEDVVIEKPKTGYSISKPSSIIFYVDPFTKMTVQGNTFFKLSNAGNIPLYVNIDYSQYDNIEINEMNKKFSVGETKTHYVTLHSESWPPGIKKINVQVEGSYPKTYFLDTNATVTLYSSFIIDLPTFEIHVGHSNYEIIEIENTGITFQYLKKLDMYEGEIKDIKAYVSGDGLVSLEIWADEENVRLLKLLDGGTETSSPIRFTSTISSERTITMRVEAVSEGKTGIINYRLTADGVTKSYTTQITIGPPKSTESKSFTMSLSIVQIVVIGLILVVIIYMFFSYSRHKRR